MEKKKKKKKVNFCGLKIGCLNCNIDIALKITQGFSDLLFRLSHTHVGIVPLVLTMSTCHAFIDMQLILLMQENYTLLLFQHGIYPDQCQCLAHFIA